MVLVDTSVWINHFKHQTGHLKELLYDGLVLCHPFIIGELACGNLKNRNEILSLLNNLPQCTIAMHDEILEFIEKRTLMGKGIGLIDVHLLASTLMSHARLWTGDSRLRTISQEMDISHK